MNDSREALRGPLQGQNPNSWRSSISGQAAELFIQQRVAHMESMADHLSRFQLNKSFFLQVAQHDSGVVSRTYFDFNAEELRFRPLVSASFTPNWAIQVSLHGERNDSLEIFWRLSGYEHDRPGEKQVTIILPGEHDENDWFQMSYDQEGDLTAIWEVFVNPDGTTNFDPFYISRDGIITIEDGEDIEMFSWQEILQGKRLGFRVAGRVYSLIAESDREKNIFFVLGQTRTKEDKEEVALIRIPLKANLRFIDELFPPPFFDDPYETDPGQDLWAKGDVKKTFGGINWEIIDMPLPQKATDTSGE